MLASNACAQSFVVQGTNVIQIAYEDSTLSASEKTFISADLMRTITPGMVFAEIEVYTNKVNAGYLYIKMPEKAHPEVLPNKRLAINGTNIIWTINKKYSDCYRANMAFFNTHSNAIAKAFEFANMLITNPLPTMPSSQAKGTYLMKSFPPYGIPDEQIDGFKMSFGEHPYFPPSLLGFSMEKFGPNDGTYLWGYLPTRTSYNVHSVPIIYYEDRWWMSYWGMDEGDQVW